MSRLQSRRFFAGSLKFLPAMLALPTWLAVALRGDLLAASFREYYPLSIAMVFGSLIAGSTPLGGGVVAFPVSVLTIGFTSAQGRDFSLLIQSVGMTAASFLVLLTKPHLVQEHGNVLAMTIFFSVLGMIAGVQLSVSPFTTMCIYTTSVASFAIILAYVEVFLQRQEKSPRLGNDDQMSSPTISLANLTESGANDDSSENLAANEMIDSLTNKDTERHPGAGEMIHLTILATFGLSGGIMSSKIGTGADMMWYAYGSLVHNFRTGARKIGDGDLTAASILVMTVTSIFGSILRITAAGTDAPSAEVYHALVACSCIVVLGAPTGSLLLSPSRRTSLKGLFYILAFAQLVSFGMIKVRSNAMAWCVICGSFGTIVASLVAVDYFVLKRNPSGTKQERSEKIDEEGESCL